MEEQKISIWGILQTITSKKNWYLKVFDKKIVGKWCKEINQEFTNVDYPGSVTDIFIYAIQILQSSAQGSNINLDTCEWHENERQFCNECYKRAEQIVRENPDEYGILNDENINDFIDGGDWIDFFDDDDDFCNHPKCTCKGPDSDLDDYIIYSHKDLLTKQQRENVKKCIFKMMEQLPVDWHPGSDKQVRDIIHPSLCSYVKGISKLKNEKCEKDVDEKERYQWLPSEISVNEEGNIKLTSYINNLRLDLFPEFISLTEQLLENFLPSFEKVLKENLKGRNLQVIVKVASTHLDSSKPKYPGGSWHIEGMPYEHIVATGLHYLIVDGITDSFLEFRKPMIINQENCEYPQSDAKFTTHHYGIEPQSHHEGNMNRYLGLIKCTEGASVVFPNTLQHRVKDFQLSSDSVKGTRIIMAFFLIDPDSNIISTRDVLPQQSLFSDKDAGYYRERLMFYRKYFINELNKEVYEREYSLCEH